MGLLSSQTWLGDESSKGSGSQPAEKLHEDVLTPQDDSNQFRSNNDTPSQQSHSPSIHRRTTSEHRSEIEQPYSHQSHTPDNAKAPVLPIPIDEKAPPYNPDSSHTSSSHDEKHIRATPCSDSIHNQISDEDVDHPDVTRNISNATASSDGGEPGEDDETKYPKSWALATLTIGLCLTTFMIALDNTIIATAIPVITSVFHSVNDVGWYGSSYLLTTTSLQPTFGKIYTYYNIKWTYLGALVMFEIGSTICGAAQSSSMLIIGRAVAGVGAAAIFSGGMIIVAYAVPLRKRSIYIALLSSMFGISSVVGPILGGVLTDKVSWRWCFFINLPIGLIAFVVVFIFFKNPERKHSKLTQREKIANIDLIGAFLLVSAITCLLLALQWGGSVYPWHDSKVWGCILGFGLILLVFTGLQFYKGEKATIPPRIILKQRTVFGCAFFSAFLAMGLYTHIYYLPFYFQAVKGTSAEESGIRTIPYLVSNTFAAIAVGASITLVGPYVPFLWIGSAIFCVGSGLIYTLKVDSNAGTWIGYQIIAGAGAGACVQIPFIAVQVVLSKKDMPVGNAIAIFFNSLGGALAISIAQNIFSNTLIKKIPIYAPGVNPQVIITAGATHIKKVVSKAQLPGVLLAYNSAITSAYVLAIATAGLAFCVSFIFEWKSVKGKKLDMGGGA